MKLRSLEKTLFTALLFLASGTGMPALAQTDQVIVWGSPGLVTNVPTEATNLVAITGGDYHALGLSRDGHVIAWGSDASGYGYTNVPETLSNVVAIAAGARHSLALRDDGTLAMWGAITSSSYVSNPPPDATNIVALAPGTGALHALALRADGTVVDWGNQSYGLAAIPSSAKHIVSVAAGSLHALALRADGRIVAWGSNNSGQTNVPANATNVVAIAAGEFTSAAIRADGTVFTWGQQSHDISFSPFVAGQRRSTDAIDIRCCPHFANIALMRDGSLGLASGFTAPPNGTNLAAIGGTSFEGLALIGKGPPFFPGLPVNRTVASGRSACFNALAYGALPLNYQWSRNSVVIPDATNTVYVVTNAEPDQMGDYSLTASNAFGTATLSNMMLTVLPVEIVSHSPSFVTNSGVPVTFTVEADGESPDYQWYLNGAPLDGATNSTLDLTNVQPADAGVYSVAVSNQFGGSMSTEWQLGVEPILVLSSPATTNPFRRATVTLSVDAVSSEPIDYHWRFNGSDIPAATSPSLTLANVQYGDSGTYSCLLSNSLGQTNLVAQISISDVADWGQYGQAIVPAGATNFLQVVSGGEFSLALKPDGTVTGWGLNPGGQLDVPDRATNVVALATGGWHCLALRNDGTIIGWGQDDKGQAEAPEDLNECGRARCRLRAQSCTAKRRHRGRLGI